jgi:hypothetical protein
VTRVHTPEERAKLFDSRVLHAIREAGATGISFLEMRPMIPTVEGQSDEQHRGAIANALSRARIKGHAKVLEGGKWISA